MLERIARTSFRHRWTVVVLWIIAIVVVGIVSSSLGTADEADFQLPDTESRQVLELLREASPTQAGSEGQLVVQVANGRVDDVVTRARIQAVVDDLGVVSDEIAVIGPFDEAARMQISDDGTIAFAQIRFPEQNSRGEMPPEAVRMIDIVDEARSADLRFELGGEYFVSFEPPESETIGLAAAIVILLLAFGSVLAVGLPIGVALAGIGTGIGLIGITSQVVVMPDFTTTLALMIGLGVGIDYALFIVTRYREHITMGDEPEAAAVAAIGTAGRAVLFAGVIVIISLLGMLLMGVQFIRGLGIGAALAVATTMVASLTLLPAFLGFVRRRIDHTTWYAVLGLVVFDLGLLSFAFGARQMLPVGAALAVVLAVVGRFVPFLRSDAPIRKPDDSSANLWHRWSAFVQRHPWSMLTAGTAILAVLALPLFSMQLGNSDNGNLPEGQTARRAYDLIAEGFGPGFNGPLILAMRTPASATPEQTMAVTEALLATEGVQFASPPLTPPGSDVTLWQVVPTTGPQEEATNELIDRLRADVLPPTGLPVLVGGTTAIFADFSDFLASRLPVFMGAVLLLSFLLLMAVFRSVLVPLKAVVVNLLSIGAAYGVVVAIFQWGWGGDLLNIGPGPIESFVPMMLFAIVFGLSMDYEVFLLSRMREEYMRTRDNSASVSEGLAVTARVITSAALIMVFVFGSFVFEDLRQIKLFGVGLAVAVLLDATVVRMLLVPATMELLGDRNWWLPGWLDRLLPTIDVEGHTRGDEHPVIESDDETDRHRDDEPVPVG
jgi:putative drug exporter of the RND superfamily